MPVLPYLSALFSSLFRLAIYVFLQIIPTRLAKPVIPTLYIASLISTWIWPLPLVLPAESASSGEKTGRDSKLQHSHSRSNGRLYDPITTIALSLPTSSLILRLTNFAINTILLAAAIDFTLTPFIDSATGVIYTRVGAVYPDSAKITVRYPLSNVTYGNEIRLIWRELKSADVDSSWNVGPTVILTEESDWVGTVKLDNLWPSTSYEYKLSTLNQTILPYPPQPIIFHTFPDPRLHNGDLFRFVATSCLTPNFPYMGPSKSRTIKGFDLLANFLMPHKYDDDSSETDGISQSSTNSTDDSNSQEAIINMTNPLSTKNINNESQVPTEFMLFLGDFIYADVPLYIGDDKEAYRRLYRRNYQSDSFRKIYENLPILHAYDDHEIINNFIGNDNDSTPPYPNARDAFDLYNADANYDPVMKGQYYYEFSRGDVAFFVMDTRRYRSTVGGGEYSTRTMLGDNQLAALYDWLSRVNQTSTFKFVVSSVPFTSLWGHDAVFDSWAGFPTERSALMNAFHTVPNVIVLSGDRHEFAAIEFSPSTEELHTFYEFSTSPLNMFYIPFIRTLSMQSVETVKRIRSSTNFTDKGPVIIEYEEDIPQEKVLKYISTGNSKWSSIEIDTRNLNEPVFRLEAIIDGKTAYNFEVVGTPVKLQTSNALGGLLSGNFIDLFDRIGIKPSKWF